MSLHDRPIQQKLTAILLVISGLVLLLTVTALAGYQYWSLRRIMREVLVVRGRVLAANSTAALAFGNVADATEVLSALRADPHVLAAALYDQDGRLFATYPPDLPVTAVPAAPGPDGYAFGSGRLAGFQSVTEIEGPRLGTLYMASDLGAVYATFKLSGIIGAVVMAVSLLAAYLLSAVLQRAISQPILLLAETARAVSVRRDYSVRAPEGGRDEVGVLTDAFNQMLDEIQRYATELEQRVAERTRELEQRAAELLAANSELDAFAYSVSHDLRAPLRSIDGFSHVLLEDYAGKLDEAGRDSLNRVRAASQRMGSLIDDLLRLARVSRAEMHAEAVDVSAMARDIAAELQRATPARQVEFAISPGLEARGDARLLRVALENLLRNSWKYTAKQARPRIEVGCVEGNGERAFMVRDNGAGFDMQYADKLFGVFQRLHSAAEFEGTGVGLATVRRIISRHGGRIWAEGAVDQGATFYFTL